MNERAAALAGATTTTIHGVHHIACRDCGDLQPHYDIQVRAGNCYCGRCADVRTPRTPAKKAGLDAATLRASLTGKASVSRPLVTLVIADKALDVRGTAAAFLKEFGTPSDTALATALEELIGVVYEHGRNHPKTTSVATESVATTATTVGTPIRVNGRDFIITEIRDGKGKHDAGRPVYILSGKRGAKYATCRNVHAPEMMFLVTERGFGIPAGWENVWLTDASGMLVAGQS